MVDSLFPLPWAFYLPTIVMVGLGVVEYDKSKGWWKRPLVGLAVQLGIHAALLSWFFSHLDSEEPPSDPVAVILTVLHFGVACWAVVWAGRSWAIMAGISWWLLTSTVFVALATLSW